MHIHKSPTGENWFRMKARGQGTAKKVTGSGRQNVNTIDGNLLGNFLTWKQ